MVNSYAFTVRPAKDGPKADRARKYGEIDSAFGEGHENIFNQAMRSLGAHGLTFSGVRDEKADLTQPMLSGGG